MTFLPIVDRELRVAARSSATYRNRSLVAGAAALVAVAALANVGSKLALGAAGAAGFRVLSWVALIFCLVEGARKTADCLSREKRGGTLGLLFLTDLRGYDIVLGKMAGASLNSVYGLVAILPVLALPLLIGGVTPGEYWRVVLALFNLLFFSLCVGMLISSLGWEEKFVVGVAILIMAGAVLAPLIAFSVIGYSYFPGLVKASRWFPLFSAAYAYHTAFASTYAAEYRGYWGALGVTQIWSWLLLAAASGLVSRTWGGGLLRGRTERWRPWVETPKEARWREELLRANPMAWLAGRGSRRMAMRVLIGLAAANSVLFLFSGDSKFMYFLLGGAVLVNLVFKMYMAADACRMLAEARHTGNLEALLTTPVSEGQILRGQVGMMTRLYFLPSFILVGVEVAGLLLGYAAASSKTKFDHEMLMNLPAFAAPYLVCFCLDFYAVVWAGLWFGLASRTKNQAVSKTILIVLITPLSTFVFPCFGMVFYLAWPVLWIWWAGQNLKANLRAMASFSENRQAVPAGMLPGEGGAGWKNLPRFEES